MYVSRDVLFDENSFFFKAINSTQCDVSQPKTSLSILAHTHVGSLGLQSVSSIIPSSQVSGPQLCLQPNSSPDLTCLPQSTPLQTLRGLSQPTSLLSPISISNPSSASVPQKISSPLLLESPSPLNPSSSTLSTHTPNNPMSSSLVENLSVSSFLVLLNLVTQCKPGPNSISTFPKLESTKLLNGLVLKLISL